MKKIGYIVLLWIGVSGCFISCRTKNKVAEQRLTDSTRLDLFRRVDSPFATVDLDEAEERPYGEFVDSIRYLVLGDECGVMGSIDMVLAWRGRYYIKENQYDRIFIYDGSGRCIKKIDSQGRGPGEYLYVKNILIDKEREELIVVDGGDDKMLFYDLDGNFKYIRRLTTFGIDNSVCLHDSTFLHVLSVWQGSEELKDYALLVTKGNETLYKGGYYLPFQKGATTGGEVFEGDDRMCYFPLYADTLYQILSDSTYGPAYCFKKKNTVWKKYRGFDRFIVEWNVDRGDWGVFPWLFETRDYLLGYIPDLKSTEKSMQHFLYDRSLDKTYLLKWDDYQFVSVIDRYEGKDIIGREGDWFIGYAAYSYFDSANILERVKNGSLKITDPVLEKILVEINMDSNPILIFTKFK